MDEVVKEVRKLREEYASKFGFDLKRIHEDLIQSQQASGRKLVRLPPKKPISVQVAPKSK